MVREELIEKAIACLQDPSVASAPLEQRIAFLRSNNLTQEEIDVSFTRIGQAPPSTTVSQPTPAQYRQPPPQYNNAYQQPPAGYAPQYWQQPPLETPQRDWRDYFIAATVMGGIGYALYWTAKRYVYPLIAPPTPPQLEQDKASIDASFDKAFALLDQLATDTQQLKESEAARKERLDSALSEVETVINRMKQANDEREIEARRMAREINEIRDQIPRAIEQEKEKTDNRLKDLGVEMKSLKTLVANRMAGGAQRTTPTFSSTPPMTGIPTATQQTSVSHEAASTEGSSPAAIEENPYGSARATYGNDRSGAGTPYGRMLGGKAAIPAWQLSQKKNAAADVNLDDGAAVTQHLSESGTVADA